LVSVFVKKIDTRIILITSTKQIIHIKSFNFNERIIYFFQEILSKRPNCISFSKIWNQIETKKIGGPT